MGGTHGRFARLDAQGALSSVVRLRNDDFSDLIQAIRQAIDRVAQPVARVALAVASPVSEGTIRLTNRDWTFSAASLGRALGVEQVRIVNDFAAAAAGVVALRAEQTVLVERDSVRTATAAPAEDRHHDADTVRIVLGPGTGLGMAAVLRTPAGWRVLGSEAGHVGCSTTEPDALPVVAEARHRWGRASWERLLCGDGLARLDASLRGGPARLPAEVAGAALAAEPTACRAARLFSRLLGEFAGDACLMLGADAVYLTGGVLDGLGAAFDGQAFREGFEDKGRFAQRMQDVPVRRVLAGDLALRGLAEIVGGGVEAAGVAYSRSVAD